MQGITWLSHRATELLDEHPSAYKDIDAVMDAQRDLVEPVHTLTQVLNYKGT
jgi:tRNA-splicing ligase RtcB